MRNIFIMTTALVLSAAPAHAQLLGGTLGGGLGGSLNGTIGGTLGGAGPVGSTVDSVRSSTSGTLRGAGSTSGSQSVNRKNGQAHADRSASATGDGGLTQAAGAPARMINGNASGNASGSGSGSLDAQLIGTDALRSTAQTARGTASGAVQSARGTAGGAAQSARGTASGGGSGALAAVGGLTSSLTGTLSGSGNAAGSGGGSGALGPVSGTGEADGDGQGGFQVTRGMPILAPDGERIGKVRQLFTNGRGEVQQMLVKVGDSTALLPATNFSASGNAVMSAMTESQIQQAAAQQQEAGATGNK